MKKKQKLHCRNFPITKSISAASLLSAMDRTAAPCVNFFQYACGAWNRLHVIPEDKSSISTFEVLADQLQVILKRVLEEPSNSDDNNATLKAKMFYKSCMDIRGYNKTNFKRVLLLKKFTFTSVIINVHRLPYLLHRSLQKF